MIAFQEKQFIIRARSILYLLFSFALMYLQSLSSQTTPIHPDYYSVYHLIDELANEGIISVNSCVKPYSREQVANWLTEALVSGKLNRRQEKEIRFYLKQFGIHLSDSIAGRKFGINPPAFSYSDSIFRCRLEPIYGIRQYINPNERLTHFWGGGSVFASIGSHWSMYANVRDNHMTGESLSREAYFTQFPGGNIKQDSNFEGSDFSEMRGGIYYSLAWGHVGLVKDHVQWGDHANGAMIFSGHSPSFPMLKIHLNPKPWLQFNYYHGWLVSELIDSSKTYINPVDNRRRETMRKKMIAANMFSFRLVKGFWLSMGNSIVYSDMDAHPAFFLPFMFYKSIDHTVSWGLSDNQNSQMFLNISVRSIKHLHLYGSVFIDELSFSRIGNPDRTNFSAQKVGTQLSNWPIKNLTFTGEFTRSTPVTFKHRVKSLTFESNGYNLGWFLRDNSTDFYTSIEWKPLKNLYLNLYYNIQRHGNEYAYASGSVEDYYPTMKDLSWSSDQKGLKVKYEMYNNLFFTCEYLKSNTKGYNIDGKSSEYYLELFTSPMYRGNISTIILGFNLGF